MPPGPHVVFLRLGGVHTWAYERIRARYSDAGGEDYIFLPEYTNRATASRIFQRQLNQLLDDTGLKYDPVTETSAASIACATPRSA